MEQRTSEWYSARLGKVTASRVADVIAKTKSGYSTSRANYMAQLICERLTGTQGESYSSAAMQWGTDTEPMAREAYEGAVGELVIETGFVPHHTIPMAGASPDGLVGADGLVEIKCPITATHIETLLGQSPPGKYVTQMQWQMACTGRKWCDFVSFDPRMPDEMKFFVKRIERDDEVINVLEREIMMFLSELDSKLSNLKEKYDGF
ncbi:phage_rel_nuc, putative phage-type endonuclease [uncultured Caudovirales phage]|uniref:Phage_rel_nuc, putative phage-type endonuclease n=1 Tax=uncultured Caudovirales phage TaxID=2100421 RepID=A0A6J7WPW4_9CAUD|nr:phage_rel_nuc, putative phage-type endonuclease [uncultured Caudovirales phage]